MWLRPHKGEQVPTCDGGKARVIPALKPPLTKGLKTSLGKEGRVVVKKKRVLGGTPKIIYDIYAIKILWPEKSHPQTKVA